MENENKLGVMPITKLIWNMSLPIIASMLVQALYNIVDSWFVSRVSEQALTAVSLAFPAQNLMIGLATGTAVGVNALMGRALGAGLRERADRVANNGVFLAVVGFVISALLGLTCSDLFFRSQTQVESIIQMGNDYLRIVTIGSLGMFCQIMYERLLQGTGRSLLSMYTQGLGAIINIILDPIFIFGLKMGVAGAAVATIIGQFCGFALAVWFNHRKNTDITLSLRGFRPDFRLIGEIYAIGLPSVIMIAIGSVMTFLMNKILITYHAAHETAATAFGVYFKLNSFIFMPIFGLNNGVIPIVAYNYGAQNRRRMMATIKRSTLYACCIMVFGTVLFWAIPDTLLRLFDASDVMLAAGVPALRIIALSFCMAGMCIALGSSFQALGKSMYSMVTSIVRQLVFLVPIAYVLARYGVKATFFVTALNSDYEDMIGRAYNEGHSIAVHTYSHDYRKIYASEEAFFEDFNAIEDVIYRQTGQYTKLCRFPGGSSNTVSQFNPGVMSRLVDIMNNMGYKYFDWNVDSDDAGHTKTTNGIYTNVTEGCYAAAGYGYCLVLQHDVKDYSVAAIESIINWGLNNGYTFAALDMTSPTAHHGISN